MANGSGDKGSKHANNLGDQAHIFKVLLEATNDAVVGVDVKGRIKTWNVGAERMFGYTAEEIIGEPNALLIPPDLLEGQRQKLQGAHESGEAMIIETERLARDGRRFHVEIAIKSIRSEAGEREVVGLLRDITERKLAERQLKFTQFTVDQAKIAVFWCYEDGRFFYVNDTACRWLEYSREELKQMHVADINPEFPRSGWPEHWREIKEKGMVRMESVHQRKSGEIYPVEIYSNCVEFEGQLYKLAFVNDISERRHAEEAKKELEEQLRQAQKMEAVGQLAGGIAHDFNNLLHVISGHADLALEELAPESPAWHDVNEVLKAGENATRLVGQLLAFSRRQLMKLESVSVNAVIDELLKMLHRTLGEHIKLVFLPGDPVAAVKGDRGMLDQVVINLSVNARDAMPDGGTLTIETRNVLIDDDYCEAHAWAKPGHYVMLTVSDSGCGMSPETQERAFEPFFTTKAQGKGTGLGLATVYGIVKQHAGMVQVYSELGRGSTFKVYIPASDGEAKRGPEQAEAEAAVIGGHEVILLAEDAEAVRTLNRRILEQAGYTVHAVSDGAAAVRCFSELEAEVDLMLFDVVMPELGGRQAARAIHERAPTVPVLYITGYSENAVHNDFVLEEGIPLIQKPHSSEELLRAVRKVLDGEGKDR
jgi:two-component system cell cycle sensor histidine kinase/response regulator CckA